MPSGEPAGRHPLPSAGREVVRFLSAGQRAWHDAFPGLHRRAQPQIIAYLATRGRGGAAVGELYGLVKQVFLLDDATVRERILEIGRRDLVRLDPAEEPLSTRTVVLPAESLLEGFDRYLLALAAPLCAAAAAIDPTAVHDPPLRLKPEHRVPILRALEAYAEPWRAALDQVFDAQSLSRARRTEAVRHLMATSHGALLHMAIEHRYGLFAPSGEEDSILADQMAAALLTLIGQNFQTTRDHIGYLIELGLLARQPGKSLRVALAPEAAPHFDAALAAAAAELPALAGRLATDDPRSAPRQPAQDDEAELRTMRARPRALMLRHYLVVAAPEAAPRTVPIEGASLSIGRLPPCDLLLPGGEVSRQHCRVDVAGGEASITDLGSTNGTFVDGRRLLAPAPLRPGATVQVGACVLTYGREAVPAPAPAAADGDGDGTLRVRVMPAAGRPAAGGNKSGNSAA